MIAVKNSKSYGIGPVSIENFNGTTHSLRELADGRPRKFVMVEIKQTNGTTDKALRIAASSNDNIFHNEIVERLRTELKDGTICIPHYGGKIVVSKTTETVIAGGNSLAYPDKMNPNEVAELLKTGMRGIFSRYRVLCKDGLDDIKSLYESVIE